MSAKKGQSILEYAILFALVIAALAIMSIYVKRAYQGRLKQGSDELSQQYSPGHTTSLTKTDTTSSSTTCTGGECWDKEITDNMTVTQSKSTTTFTRKEGIDSFATE
jgi:uncharacterized protein (UPF0333 family)